MKHQTRELGVFRTWGDFFVAVLILGIVALGMFGMARFALVAAGKGPCIGFAIGLAVGALMWRRS